MLKGPAAWGFPTPLWTLQRVTRVIWKTCHLPATAAGMSGASCERWGGAGSDPLAGPRNATRPRSPSGCGSAGPRLKENRRLKAWLGFLDESGFLAAAPYRGHLAPQRPDALPE
jgi:hypothetical protein